MFGRKGCPSGYEIIDDECYPKLKNKSVMRYSKIEERDDIRLATEKDVEQIKRIYSHNPNLNKFDMFFVKDRENGFSEIFGHFNDYVFELKVPAT